MARSGTKSRPLTRAGQWIVYALFRCVEAVLAALPLRVVWHIGRGVGALGYWIAPGYRNTALKNLRIAFGKEKSEAERRQIAREHFKSLFANFFCGLKIPLMTQAQIMKHVRSDGTEHVQAAFDANKRPILNLVLHASCWEILTQAPQAYLRGHKAGAIYQPLRNPWLNALVLRRRQKLGYTLFDRQGGFNAPMKFMRDGGQIGVLVDQHAGDKGVWCPFFGRLASSTPIAALMAMRTGAVIQPIMVYNDGPARWRISVSPELISPEKEPSAEGITAQINRTVEQIIRQQPESWFWVHERWKTPKPQFLINFYKRGITLPEGTQIGDVQPFEMLIRSPNWLGDACMAFPMVRAIHAGRPDIRITVIGPDKLEQLWLSMPEVTRYIAKPAKESLFAVARRIKATGVHFDAAVLCTNSTRSTLEIWLAGIPRRVGFKGSLRAKLLNQIVPEPASSGQIMHHAHRYLSLAHAIGADITPESLWSTPQAELPADGITRIGICAGAEYGPAKRWPMERFAAVAQQVSATRAEVQWQLFGAPGEKAMGEQLSTQLGSAPHANLVGKTSLNELIARLKQCRLLLTNDTGTMHLAAALGVPTVSIFGSTCPVATGPLGTKHIVIRHQQPCAPCFDRECRYGHYDCMTKISVDEVAQAVLRAIA